MQVKISYYSQRPKTILPVQLPVFQVNQTYNIHIHSLKVTKLNLEGN